MKKLVFLFATILTVGMFAVSCGSDDDKTAVNVFLFDGVEYELDPTTFEVRDYGCSGGECNYDFVASTGDLSFNLYIELYQMTDGEEFTGGTFSIWDEGSPANYWDGDEVCDNVEEACFSPIDGTVKAQKLSGTNNWKLTLDYTYVDEMTGTGVISGEFEYVDNTQGRVGTLK